MDRLGQAGAHEAETIGPASSVQDDDGTREAK